jgi:P4 family phage/plasmid primase-like protien
MSLHCVEHRQEPLEKLHVQMFPEKAKAVHKPTQGTSVSVGFDDTELIDRASKAKGGHGPKFAKLFAGDWTSAGFSSQSEADMSLCSSLYFWTGGDLTRTEQLFRASVLMRDKWDEKHFSNGNTYGQATLKKCVGGKVYTPKRELSHASKATFLTSEPTAQNVGEIGFHRPLPDASSIRELTKSEDYGPTDIAQLLGYEWDFIDTDISLAARLALYLSVELAYAIGLGWLVWDRKRWRMDEGRTPILARKRAERIAKIVTQETTFLYQCVAVLLDKDRKEDASKLAGLADGYLKFASRCQSAAKLKAMLEIGAGHVAKEREVFEIRAWLIGFQNKTWDNGVTRDHQKGDHLLELCAVNLDSAANQNDWLEVLNAMTNGDEDLAKSLQDVAGYVLSGYSGLKILPWLYGPRDTGKSTFVGLLQTLLGLLAGSVDTQLLTANADRAKLGAVMWGKRCVVLHEAGSAKLSAELLKTISGGDAFPVKFLYKEPFTAIPRHTLLLVANDAPRFTNAYDDALKKRIFALPFVHRLSEFPDGSPRTLLGGRKLEALRDDPNSDLVKGFTAWAAVGLERVFETRLVHRAVAVDLASQGLWQDSDPLTGFWNDESEGMDFAKGVLKSELRRKYDEWAQANGERPLNRTQWVKACAAHGLEDFKATGGVRVWRRNSGTSGTTKAISTFTREIDKEIAYKVKTGQVVPLVPLLEPDRVADAVAAWAESEVSYDLD